MATANMSGCASIDFSASVSIAGQGPYRLIVDTGSTTLAVVSSLCSTCDDAHPTYTPAAGTQADNDAAVSSTYGGGTSWSGHVYSAQVAVGDSEAVSMDLATIEANSGFIDGSKVCAVNSDAKIGLNNSQGIIGFAYPTIAIGGTDSFIHNYIAATGVSAQFTLAMCPTGGNLWIGGLDADFLGGQFSYVPIIKPNFYAVMLTDISVLTGGNSSQSLGYTMANYGPCVADNNADCSIVDSGTTLMQLPTAVFNRLVNIIEADTYYQHIFGPGGYASIDPLTASGQCAGLPSDAPSSEEMNANLPQLQLTFTDINSASPVTITLQALPGYLSVNFDEKGNTFYCAGIGATSAYTILGYAFMNQFTVLHDLANQRLGFALTAQCGVMAPPLPNYKWVTGEWQGGCSVSSCGGGVQWRSVDCVDIYGTKHPDIACGTSYTAQRPTDSQTCNTDTCASVTAAQFSSVTPSNTTVTQGDTITISYAHSGSADFVTLFVSPSGSSSTQSTFSSYIARNASGGTGSGTFAWYVPSSLAAGTYDIGAYTMLSYGNSIYMSGSALTVQSCTTGACALGMDVCTASTCSGRGECDVTLDNVAECTCVSAYNGTRCEQLVACNTQCINGGTMSTSGECACVCPSGFTGALCEQVYANISAVLSLDPASVASPANAAAFQSAFVADIAYALGLRPAAVVVQSVGANNSGNDTLVSFQLASMCASAELAGYAALLASKLQAMLSFSSALSTGLASAYVTSLDILAGPPATADFDSSSSLASRYWIFIVAGIVGFALVFTVLYWANGGRCAGCRRDKVDSSLTRIGPKGSGSMNAQGQIVAGGGGGHEQHRKHHERRPTHEPRHSYFAQSKVGVAV